MWVAPQMIIKLVGEKNDVRDLSKIQRKQSGKGLTNDFDKFQDKNNELTIVFIWLGQSEEDF